MKGTTDLLLTPSRKADRANFQKMSEFAAAVICGVGGEEKEGNCRSTPWVKRAWVAIFNEDNAMRRTVMPHLAYSEVYSEDLTAAELRSIL